MPHRELKELLQSAEKRVLFAAEQTEGAVSSELEEAAREIGECIEQLSPREIPSGGGTTVMFIDDEDIIRNIASRMLSMAGYSVLTAADGREGLEIFRKSPEDVACVIIDLVMPGMNGIQVADTIAAERPGTGIILTSGYGEDEIRKKYGSLGTDDFLRKPFNSAMLVSMVERVLKKREEV